MIVQFCCRYITGVNHRTCYKSSKFKLVLCECTCTHINALPYDKKKYLYKYKIQIQHRSYFKKMMFYKKKV